MEWEDPQKRFGSSEARFEVVAFPAREPLLKLSGDVPRYGNWLAMEREEPDAGGTESDARSRTGVEGVVRSTAVAAEALNSIWWNQHVPRCQH